jgi:hypothetical protein
MKSFYGYGISYSNIWIEIIIFCILILGFKFLADKKELKLDSLCWLLIVFIIFIVTNVISSFI